MPQITHAIPALAKSAIQLANAQHQNTVNQLAKQTVEAMGLDSALPWRCDFNEGTVSLDVPDAVKPDISPAAEAG